MPCNTFSNKGGWSTVVGWRVAIAIPATMAMTPPIAKIPARNITIPSHPSKLGDRSRIGGDKSVSPSGVTVFKSVTAVLTDHESGDESGKGELGTENLNYIQQPSHSKPLKYWTLRLR